MQISLHLRFRRKDLLTICHAGATQDWAAHDKADNNASLSLLFISYSKLNKPNGKAFSSAIFERDR